MANLTNRDGDRRRAKPAYGTPRYAVSRYRPLTCTCGRTDGSHATACRAYKTLRRRAERARRRNGDAAPALPMDRKADVLANLSPLGKRLLALREEYIAAGGRLYSSDEISREIATSRGYRAKS